MGQKKNSNHNSNQNNSNSEVEVLYQKMGSRWYAFSLIGDEVYLGSIEQDSIDNGAMSLDEK